MGEKWRQGQTGKVYVIISHARLGLVATVHAGQKVVPTASQERSFKEGFEAQSYCRIHTMGKQGEWHGSWSAPARLF